jgi:hypothetical protein
MLKEHHMRDALKESFPEINMIFNKQVDNSCSARRPDVRIEKLTHSIIVECDENQHSSAGYSCENKRLMEIFQDLGNRPLVVIRFNPDKYITTEGIKIPSCFGQTMTGQLKLDKKEWKSRIEILTKMITQYNENIPTQELTIITLFY